MQVFNRRFKKLKSTTQTGRVLELIKRNNKYGTTNFELSRVALKYSSRIDNLRKEGYNIQAVRITKGTWKYYLNEESWIDKLNIS